MHTLFRFVRFAVSLFPLADSKGRKHQDKVAGLDENVGCVVVHLHFCFFMGHASDQAETIPTPSKTDRYQYKRNHLCAVIQACITSTASSCVAFHNVTCPFKIVRCYHTFQFSRRSSVYHCLVNKSEMKGKFTISVGAEAQ